MDEKKKDLQVEEAFKELEEIIRKLEGEKTSLREAIQLYSEGAQLIHSCREELQGIEKEMIIIDESMEQGENIDAV